MCSPYSAHSDPETATVENITRATESTIAIFTFMTHLIYMSKELFGKYSLNIQSPSLTSS